MAIRNEGRGRSKSNIPQNPLAAGPANLEGSERDVFLKFFIVRNLNSSAKFKFLSVPHLRLGKLNNPVISVSHWNMSEDSNQRSLMEYLPIEVVSHIFSFLPTIEDRKAASLVCKLWYEAYQSPTLRKKELVVISSNEVFGELYALTNPNRVFANVNARGVEINRSTRKFWRRYGPYIRTLSINSCDVREKTFVKLMKKCEELESLSIQDCRELFMSGYLLENEHERATLRRTLVHVRSLGLGYNRYLSDSLFVRFTSICPNVQDLLLPGCYITFHSGLYNRFYLNGQNDPSESILTFTAIHDYIKANASRLKALSFAETLIDSEAVNLIARTPRLALNKLFLRGCVQITSESLITITEFQIYLTHLDIALCPRVTDDTLLMICSRLTGLKSLSVQGCRNLTDAGVSDLWKLNDIVRLNISECEGVHDAGILKGLATRTNYTLQDLFMSHLGQITDESVATIMEFLPNLRTLDLGYCFKAVTDRAVQAIFINAKQLRSLILTMCDGLTDRGLTGLALEPPPPPAETKEARLREIMKTQDNPRLLEDDPQGGDAEEASKNIDITKDLKGDCLGDLKGLLSLTLSGCNRITDMSIKYGFKLRDLKCLDLSGCQLITAKGLSYIVRYNKALEILNLDNCHNIDDEGVGYVLRNLKRLKSLALGSNRITDRIIHYVGQSNSNLSYLDVRHCNQLSAHTVNKIIAYYPHLQVVHFSTKGNDFQYTAPHPPPPPYRAF